MKELASLFLVCSLCSAQDAKRPNIVLIMADDMGYESITQVKRCS